MKLLAKLVPLWAAEISLSIVIGGRASSAFACDMAPTVVDAHECAPLLAFQKDLLDIAFDTASAIPLSPHIKERSRQQEAVLSDCLTAGDIQRAVSQVDHIANWQRGLGYAKIALHLARQGETTDVRRYLDLAGDVAANEEDWRRDQIRVTIAQTHEWLGDAEQVAVFEANLVSSEAGKVEAIRALRIEPASLDEMRSRLSVLVESRNFDLIRNAMDAYAALHNRFYGDEARRTALEQAIVNGSDNLPIIVRIELRIRMSESAVKHADQTGARAILEGAVGLLNSYEWNPEDRVVLSARLARMRHLAGEPEAAVQEANATLAFYLSQRAQIESMHRARALRPLAEAYQTMGDASAARRMYAQVIEEGAENVNARPRAIDLANTCRSMALHGVEPDAELWARIRQLKEGLEDPW